MHASAWLVCGLILAQAPSTVPPAKPATAPPTESIPTQWAAPVTVKSKAPARESASRESEPAPRAARVLPPLRPTQPPVVVSDGASLTGETTPQNDDPSAGSAASNVREATESAAPPRPFPPAPTTRPLRSDEPRHLEESPTRQVNFEAPAPNSTASLLVRHAMTAPDDESWRLTGAPFSLYSALERSSDRTSRLALVRAYWRMTTEVASYNWAVEEGAFIAGLQAAGRGSDEFLLNAARLDAQAHLQSAKVAAIGAQQDLAEYARISWQSPPPLPLDQPLATAYQTKFERIFANRTPPAGLRRIAQTIPVQLELVETQAAAVAADTDAAKELAAAHQQGQATLESVVAAHERLYRHRREFLQSLRVYNELIAEYALAVGSGSPNETLVSMLIRNPSTPRAATARARSANFDEAPNAATARNVPAHVPPTQDAMIGGPSTDASPRTSSRSTGNGSWMAPRTTVRDNAIRGTAAVEEPSTRFAPRPVEEAASEGPSNAPPPRGFPGGAASEEEGAIVESPEGADARPSLGSPFPGR